MQHIDKVVGKPCNASEGCMTRGGNSRPDKVKLGKKGGSWPEAKKYAVSGVSGSGTPRYRSHLD